MKRFGLYILALSIGSGIALAQEPVSARVIASAKDWSITAQQFEQFLELLPDQQHAYFSTHRREFLDQLVRIWVMAGEARSLGFDQAPKYKATVDFYSNNMLAGEMHTRRVAGNSTANDEAVKAFYESHKDDFRLVRLSQILVPDSERPLVREQRIPGALPPREARRQIEQALSKLRGGARFEDVAREYSRDEASAGKGGDLGYVLPGQMPATLEAAASTLKEGAFSGIIESPFGFHILYVSEIKIAPLAEVGPQIREKLDADRFDAHVQDKIKEAQVTIDETFFKN